jgi:hypothetical protein
MFARADVIVVFSEQKAFHVDPDTLSTATLQIKLVHYCMISSHGLLQYTWIHNMQDMQEPTEFIGSLL